MFTDESREYERQMRERARELEHALRNAEHDIRHAERQRIKTLEHAMKQAEHDIEHAIKHSMKDEMDGLLSIRNAGPRSMGEIMAEMDGYVSYYEDKFSIIAERLKQLEKYLQSMKNSVKA